LKVFFSFLDSDEGETSSRSVLEKVLPKVQDLIITNDLEPGSYPGWKLYFPLKSFRESSEIAAKVETYQKFIKSDIINYDLDKIAQEYHFEMNVKSLLGNQDFMSEWQNFKKDLRFNPTETMAIAGLALHNIISKRQNNVHKKIFVRPVGYNFNVNIKDAREMRNELLKVSGLIVTQNEIESHAKMMCYKCSMCQSELIVIQNSEVNNGKHIFPSKCKRGCTAKGNFKEMLSSPFTIYQPQKFIKIQAVSMNSDKQLEVELIQNYCGDERFTIGAKVSCTGIIKFKSAKKTSRFSKGGEAGDVSEYLKCFHIELSDPLKSMHEKNVTGNDIDVINTLRTEPSIFRLLVHSIAPDIFGREEVKAGLLLALLSGHGETKKRAESHVLLIGNPGNGKSQLLLACAEISSNGHYVNGPTSTSVALTATVGKNNVNAGTFVTANDGVCCIDELDKMPTLHSQSLLECMEQQTVSFTKHGARGQLPARVSIIAAANPISSFYNRDKTLAQNVKISVPILSRFDLTFILVDQPKSKDNELLAHLNHRSDKTNQFSFFTQSSARSSNLNFDHTNLKWLKAQNGEEILPLELSKLKLFIQYARFNIHPKLLEETKIEIAKYYFKMLEDQNCNVTTRNLEALIRLVIARARADLKTEATLDHALDVINIIKFSKAEVYGDDDMQDYDSELRPPAAKKPKVTTQSIPKQMKALVEHLLNHAESLGCKTFTHAEIKALAKEIGIERSYDEVIFKLNNQGFILKTPQGYKVH
jgi:DNA helicase MCM8